MRHTFVIEVESTTPNETPEAIAGWLYAQLDYAYTVGMHRHNYPNPGDYSGPPQIVKIETRPVPYAIERRTD